MKARYRLPAELGGGEIVAEYGGYAAGKHQYIGGILDGFGSVDLSLARRMVEIKPPSITDPSRWPLTIEHGDARLVLRNQPIGNDSDGTGVELVLSTPRTTTVIRLTAEDLRELAKSAWQHVEGHLSGRELVIAPPPGDSDAVASISLISPTGTVFGRLDLRETPTDDAITALTQLRAAKGRA